MTSAPIKTWFETQLRGVPIPALRDIVAKKPSEGSNVDALDGVRGLAVALVIASHCEAIHMKGQGALGVFLFFTLSAFLLTMPYARNPERATSVPRLRRYAARRVRRILPVYYGIILFTFFQERGAGLPYLWRHLAFVRADGIFWTIPQEMLFYLFLPVLALAHPLLFRRNFGLAAAACLVFAWSCHTFLTESIFTLNGNGKELRFHLGIFATGMAFSYAYYSPTLSRITARTDVNRILGWVGLAMLPMLVLSSRYWHETVLNELPLIGVWFQSVQPKMGLYYKGTFAFLGGLLIYITLVCRTRMIHRVMSSLTLRALGLTSYSLYLIHIIVRDKISTLGVGMGNELFVWTMLVGYAIAATSYALIERPFMQMRTS